VTNPLILLGNDESKRCPNVWLEDKYLPGLKTTALDFMAECRALQVKALKALALGMEHVPADFFEDYHTDEDNQLRLLHCTTIFFSFTISRGSTTRDLTCRQILQPLARCLSEEKKAALARTLWVPSSASSTSHPKLTRTGLFHMHLPLPGRCRRPGGGRPCKARS
jgi:hypothetical protein